MKFAPIPPNDIQRLEKLYSYEILDTLNDPKFDLITEAVAKICGTKIALISLIDKDRQWFKSKYGLEAKETPRDISFCGHAIMGNELFEVENSEWDERFSDNPLFRGEPHVRFYAGMPLITADNYRLGTICVIDEVSKKLTDEQKSVLKAFSQNIVELLELNSRNKHLRIVTQQYLDVQKMVQAGAWELDVKTEETKWSDQIYEIYKIPKGTPTNKIDGLSHYAPHEREKLSNLIASCIARGEGFDDTFEFYDSENQKKWVRSIGRSIKNSSAEVVKVVGTFQDVSDHIKVLNKTKELSLENQKYRLWIENTEEGVWQIDANGETLFVNKALANMLEYKVEDFVGRSFLLFIQDHDKELAVKKLADWNQGKSETLTWRMLSKSGNGVWLNLSVFPSFVDAGNVSSIVAMCSNITTIKDKQTELELVLSNITEGYFDWHIKDDYEFMSSRFWDILGYDHKEKMHHPSEWQKLMHPEDLESAMLNFDLHVKTRGSHPFRLDARYKHSSGDYRWIKCEGKIIEWDQNGNALRMVGTHQDIHSEKVRANEAAIIKRGLESYAIVVKTDAKGIITYTNDLFCEISKYSRNELIGSNHRILNSGHHESVFFKDMWQTIRSKKSWRGEIKNKAKDGSFYWVDTTIIPIISVVGEIEGYTAFRYDITQRKLAEIALSESENKHKQIYSQSRDPVMTLYPPSWQFSSCNKATLELFGVKSESEFVKLGPWDLSPELQENGIPSSQLAQESIKQAMAEGSHFFEWIHKKISGESIPCTVLLSRIQDRDSCYLQATVRDVSKEKKLLSKLAESNEQLRQISTELNKFFDLTLNYLCIASTQGMFLKINKAWLSLGYTEDELTTNPFTYFIHPDDLPGTFKEVEKLSRGVPTVNFENRYRKKDGSYIQLEWVTSSDPTTGLLFAAATDVTERKRREELALLLSHVRSRFIELSSNKEAFFKFLLNKILELTTSEYGFIGEILADKNGKYLKTFALTDISWDAETRKFYQENAPQGLEFRNLNTLFGEVIKTGKLLITNNAPSHPKASGIPKGHPGLDKFMGIPIFYNGEMFAMVGVANSKWGYKEDDFVYLRPFFELIGEMIQSLKLNSELELQKKISLHHSKLASIGELAAGVGHEINNPLAIIRGQVEMIKDFCEAHKINHPEIDVKVMKSLKGVERIANIVKGLRSFARADDKEMILLNLSDLIKDTEDMLHEIYIKEGVSMTFLVDDDLCVSGNRGQLQQVLVNILNNAKDAVVSSEVKEIVVKAYRKAKSILIEICDSGPGVPDDIKEKIFDPFFTTKDVNKGTGIGLALVSSIIKDHEGVIEIENRKGRGACFTITLQAQAQAQIQPQPQTQTQVQPQTQSQGHVLVVDDEEDLREILQDILELHGLKVWSVSNGQEAFEYVTKNYSNIDLIISDMKMPIMNGPELARKVHSFGKYKGAFLFITGGINISIDEYSDLVDGILPKPFNKEATIETIKNWIKNEN